MLLRLYSYSPFAFLVDAFGYQLQICFYLAFNDKSMCLLQCKKSED